MRMFVYKYTPRMFACMIIRYVSWQRPDEAQNVERLQKQYSSAAGDW